MRSWNFFLIEDSGKIVELVYERIKNCRAREATPQQYHRGKG